MTTDRIVCRRCGFANLAGDQFCGSCGAFLEWEGQEGVEAQPAVPERGAFAGGAPEGTAPDAVGEGEPEDWSGRFFPTPPPIDERAEAASLTVAPPPEPGVEVSAGGLVRCTKCGIANPVGRTFCQTCGEKLPAGEAIDIEATRAAWIAKGGANAEPPTPKPQVPGTAGAPRPAPKAAAADTKGGFPTWILWVALLGIAVGVAVVVFTQLDLGPDASSGATGAPSLAPSPTAPPSPSASPAPSAPSAFSGAPAHRGAVSAAHPRTELAYFAPMSRPVAPATVCAVAARPAAFPVTRA